MLKRLFDAITNWLVPELGPLRDAHLDALEAMYHVAHSETPAPQPEPRQ